MPAPMRDPQATLVVPLPSNPSCALLPILSTYLGHGHVTDTYWYVTSTPELMATVGERLEKRWEGFRRRIRAASPLSWSRSSRNA